MYDFKVYDDKHVKDYKNAKAPIHITTGSAGCWEEHSELITTKVPWLASYDTQIYGFTRLHFESKLHMVLEQVSVDKVSYKYIQKTFFGLINIYFVIE